MSCDKCGDFLAVDTPIGQLCGDCFHVAAASLPDDLANMVYMAVSVFVQVSKEVERYTLGLSYDTTSVQIVINSNE